MWGAGGVAEVKCIRGGGDVYTDADKMALSFWLNLLRGHVIVALSAKKRCQSRCFQ